MELKNYKTVLNLLVVTLILYLVHKGLFYWREIDTSKFYYSLETLYLVYSGCSLVLLLILVRISGKNKEHVGMGFIWITGIKIMICCLLLIPLFARSTNHKSLENINFFVMFILFLTIETILSIRILNNKQ